MGLSMAAARATATGYVPSADLRSLLEPTWRWISFMISKPAVRTCSKETGDPRVVRRRLAVELVPIELDELPVVREGAEGDHVPRDTSAVEELAGLCQAVGHRSLGHQAGSLLLEARRALGLIADLGERG